jgi:hypothetical protein
MRCQLEHAYKWTGLFVFMLKFMDSKIEGVGTSHVTY